MIPKKMKAGKTSSEEQSRGRLHHIRHKILGLQQQEQEEESSDPGSGGAPADHK